MDELNMQFWSKTAMGTLIWMSCICSSGVDSYGNTYTDELHM